MCWTIFPFSKKSLNFEIPNHQPIPFFVSLTNRISEIEKGMTTPKEVDGSKEEDDTTAPVLAHLLRSWRRISINFAKTRESLGVEVREELKEAKENLCSLFFFPLEMAATRDNKGIVSQSPSHYFLRNLFLVSSDLIHILGVYISIISLLNSWPCEEAIISWHSFLLIFST